MSPQASAYQAVADEIANSRGYSNCTFRGRGAFKDTFSAVLPDGSLIAIKVIDQARSNKDRTVREIEALRRCTSPFIGRVRDFYVHSSQGGQMFDIVEEEYLDGGTLESRLATAALSLDQLKKLGLGLGHAVVEIASLQLVHRDIKPANIMFRSVGSDSPILVDFGIVRDLAKASLTASWMMTGPGTPCYAAPEQLNNEIQNIDWRTDQFATGVVLTYGLLGYHPYQQSGMSISEAVAAVAARRASPELAQRLRGTGFEFIEKMVAPWPVERFSQPQQLLQTIENI